MGGGGVNLRYPIRIREGSNRVSIVNQSTTSFSLIFSKIHFILGKDSVILERIVTLEPLVSDVGSRET